MMLAYSILFWLWFVYGAANAGNTPIQMVVVVLLPAPFILQALGVL